MVSPAFMRLLKGVDLGQLSMGATCRGRECRIPTFRQQRRVVCEGCGPEVVTRVRLVVRKVRICECSSPGYHELSAPVSVYQHHRAPLILSNYLTYGSSAGLKRAASGQSTHMP